MRKNRRAVRLLAAAAAAFCLFSLPGTLRVRAEAVESETEMPAEDAGAASGPLLSPEMIGELKNLIDGLKVEDIYEIASTAWGVGNSEEFKRLIEYPEMQALVKSALKKGIEVASDDPQMAKEILVTLGVEESYVDLLEELVRTAGSLDMDMVGALLGSL